MPPKNIIKNIANTRIIFLFQLAQEIFPENKELASRYIYLAKKYAQRAKIQIPPIWKKRVCHKCKQFLYPGINCKIRIQSRKGKGSHVSMTCLECYNITRYYIKTKKFRFF